MKTLMVLAGGTGGHVFPALAVAELWRSAGGMVEWIGTEHGIENRLVPAKGIMLHRLAVHGMRGKGMVHRLKAPLPLLKALLQSWRLLRRTEVVVVLGMGGYVTGPAGIAARLAGKPLVLHEQNAVAGLSNRLLAPLATRVLTGFPGVFRGHRQHVFVGNPVRQEIIRPSPTPVAEPDGLKILVLGGSQGAQALNEHVPEVLQCCWKRWKQSGLRTLSVLHQTGERQRAETRNRYEGWGEGFSVEVSAFIDNMQQAYLQADLVICRSGALTVAELAAAAKPSILVPFPFAVDDHQTRNAEYLVQAGAAVLCPQPLLTEGALEQALERLRSPAVRKEMAQNAFARAKVDATETIVRICREVALS